MFGVENVQIFKETRKANGMKDSQIDLVFHNIKADWIVACRQWRLQKVKSSLICIWWQARSDPSWRTKVRILFRCPISIRLSVFMAPPASCGDGDRTLDPLLCPLKGMKNVINRMLVQLQGLTSMYVPSFTGRYLLISSRRLSMAPSRPVTILERCIFLLSD